MNLDNLSVESIEKFISDYDKKIAETQRLANEFRNTTSSPNGAITVTAYLLGKREIRINENAANKIGVSALEKLIVQTHNENISFLKHDRTKLN